MIGHGMCFCAFIKFEGMPLFETRKPARKNHAGFIRRCIRRMNSVAASSGGNAIWRYLEDVVYKN